MTQRYRQTLATTGNGPLGPQPTRHSLIAACAVFSYSNAYPALRGRGGNCYHHCLWLVTSPWHVPSNCRLCPEALCSVPPLVLADAKNSCFVKRLGFMFVYLELLPTPMVDPWSWESTFTIWASSRLAFLSSFWDSGAGQSHDHLQTAECAAPS